MTCFNFHSLLCSLHVFMACFSGDTALHIASRRGNHEIVKQLLSCVGTGTHIKNKEGKTAVEYSQNDEVQQLFQSVCRKIPAATAKTTIATRTVSTTPKIAQQQQQPHNLVAQDLLESSFSLPQNNPPPPSTANKSSSSSSLTSSQPQSMQAPQTVGRQGRASWEIEAKQQKNEITELKARITQLEDENSKNLKLLHDERKCRQVDQQRFHELQQNWKQNSEMELQRLQEKTVLDMTAKNNAELMELEAHITTLEEESAKNLKIFCDERALEQQRFRDLQHYTTHVMSHVEQGDGSWRNILLPENNSDNNCNNCNNCKQSQVRVVFEDLPSFEEIVCGSCSLQMVVKLIISRRFGVEPTQQVIFIVGSDECSEELLTDPFRTLEEILQQRQQGNSGNSISTNGVVVSILVRIKSSMTIQEKDLKVISTLGSGSYGTVFKCTFLHKNTAAATSSSSSSSETTTFVAVKALHEIIRSEFNINQFQQEALISSRLRHPNIVRCLGTCITSTGSLWIVSELMELSLRQLLHHKKLTFTEVVAVSSGIAKGMTALHMRNFMHRDLSSNNVLLDSCGIPKIADFGVSRALPSNGAATALRTFTNGAGTPVYLSPQMRTGHYGIKGDMWEFAVLLSELLRGSTPEAIVPKAATQILEFIRVQKTQLAPPEIAEVTRLCTDAGDYPVVECLIRRNAIIEALRLDPELNNTHPACVGQFSLVVESCLSILEINRPSFPVIERMLMTCAEIVFANSRNTTTATTAANTTANAPMIDNRDVTAHITTCLANMAVSFPGRNNNTTSSS
ncbi:Serine/threonine-protein kinase [Pelomyxa schiedti]|nr:Serine/threonine-protein kinase [Pelomyxa schiedti]